MTPDEPNPGPLDAESVARMMEYDSLVHDEPHGDVSGATGSTAEDPADEQARERLLLLLRLLDAADGPDAAAEPGPADDGREPETLWNRFEVIEHLGAGGFGFVVRARDRLLGREVALKMPRLERALQPGDVRRFLREARAAARLDHPHIVRVYDARELGPLGYFIATEYCPGPSLRSWLGSHKGAVPARLAAAWLAALADAAQHAHDRGIVHRDIKPDNIILADPASDGSFTPRLADFGLARDREEVADESRGDERAGTAQYMAPEQVAGHHDQIGPATDVYALGATLYEVLTGRTPFRGESASETLRLVLNAEPVAPRSLRPGLPRDLETICLKCLHKEPSRRYRSAADLRDDLLLFLDGRPIRARRSSGAERAARWCLRNPVIAGLLAAVFLLMATVAIVASAGYVRESAARSRAESAESAARGEAARAHAAEHDLRREWYAANVNLMQAAWDAGQVGRLRELLADTEGYRERRFEWSYWHRLSRMDRYALTGHRGAVRGVSWSPDGSRLATASWDGTARIWDARDGRPVLVLAGHDGQVNSLAWSPDGRSIATAGWDGTARVWDAVDGRQKLRIATHSGRVRSVAWSPDGTRLATAAEDGLVRTWSATDGLEGPPFRGAASCMLCVAWSPDGTSLAAGGVDGKTRIWRTADGGLRSTLEGGGGWINSVAWSPDGKSLAAATQDGTVRIWDAATGRDQLVHVAYAGWINSVAWSPDGTTLATANSDGSARIREARDGRQLLILRKHRSQVVSVAWAPDGRSLAAGGADGHSHVWQVGGDSQSRIVDAHHDKINAVAWAPDGNRLVTASWDGTAKVWDADSRVEILALRGHDGGAWTAAWSPDGRRLATAGTDGTAKVWDAGGRLLATLRGHTSRIICAAWSPDGGRVATASWDGTARVWDPETGGELIALPDHASEVWSVAWSRDGTHLATGSRNGILRIWDLATRRALLVADGNRRRVIGLSWSPDGTRLASGAADDAIRIHDAAGRTLATLQGHTGEIRSVAWSPDSTRLASASADGTSKVWDPATGRELVTLKGHIGFVRSVAWSPDGSRLATTGDDGTVRIWDSAPGDAPSAADRPDPPDSERPTLASRTPGGPDDGGVIRSWLVLTLPCGRGESSLQALDHSYLPDEARVRPHPGKTVSFDGRILTWRAHRPATPVLDLNAFLGRATERSVAYAVSYVASDRARDARLEVGSDDLSKVYLNGREIYCCPSPRPLDNVDSIGPIRLEAGTNVLVLKVVNETANWEAVARLTDDQGRPLDGIVVKGSP